MILSPPPHIQKQKFAENLVFEQFEEIPKYLLYFRVSHKIEKRLSPQIKRISVKKIFVLVSEQHYAKFRKIEQKFICLQFVMSKDL